MSSEATRAWLAGAVGRLDGPVSEDRVEDVQRRVVQLASNVQMASNLDGRPVVWLDCPACGLDGGPYNLDQAGQLAGVHDDLHHRGQPTALILGGAQ